AAGGVFVATQLTFLNRVVFAQWATPYRLEGIWIVIVGLGLLGVGVAGRAPTLVGWAIAVCGTGAAVFLIGYQSWTADNYQFGLTVPTPVVGPMQPYLVIGLGVALTI